MQTCTLTFFHRLGSDRTRSLFRFIGSHSGGLWSCCLSTVSFQVPIVDFDKCQERMGEFLSSSTDFVLCAGGEGNSVNQVRIFIVID